MKMRGLNDPLLKTEIALNVKLIPVVGVGAQCGRRFAISGGKYRDSEIDMQNNERNDREE